MTIKQESELCLITYFAVCGICIEEKGTEEWVNILRQIWQTIDNYWGGIVERTKIPSQIPKGDFQIKLRVPFIKKFYTSWESLDVGCRRLLRWLRIFRNSLMHLVEGGGRGVPLLGRSPEDAGVEVDHWGSHQPRATPSFKAKLVSMFVDCRFLEEKSKIGYIQGLREHILSKINNW